MQDNKICVYAICKNESKFVKKWLDSMQEADYIVVLDTGSTDDTYKLLKEDPRVTIVKKHVIKPWRFDVARNESMKLVPEDANILVCTDLDEVFEPGWAEILRTFWKEDTTRCFYNYAWSHNEIGEPQDEFTYDKIHNRNYKWIYPVHEVLALVDENKPQVSMDARAAIRLHHYPDTKKDRTCYFDLLKLSASENPDSSHVRMLLAREYAIYGQLQEALDIYLSILKMPTIDNPNERLVLLYTLLSIATLYHQLGNNNEAVLYCHDFIKIDPTYRDPYFLLGEIYNRMELFTLAKSVILAGNEFGVRKYNWVERTKTWSVWGDFELAIAFINLPKTDSMDESANAACASELVKRVLEHEPSNVEVLKLAHAIDTKRIELLTKK